MSNLPANVTDADIDAAFGPLMCEREGCTREADRVVAAWLSRRMPLALCTTHYEEERLMRADDLRIERERESPWLRIASGLARRAAP